MDQQELRRHFSGHFFKLCAIEQHHHKSELVIMLMEGNGWLLHKNLIALDRLVLKDFKQDIILYLLSLHQSRALKTH